MAYYAGMIFLDKGDDLVVIVKRPAGEPAAVKKACPCLVFGKGGQVYAGKDFVFHSMNDFVISNGSIK